MATLDSGGWSDAHDDGMEPLRVGDAPLWERPAAHPTTTFVPHVAIVGPQTHLTRTLAHALLTRLVHAALKPLVVIVDADGWEEATQLRNMLSATTDAARIVSVTGTQPQVPAALLNAVMSDLTARFPDADLLCLMGSMAAANALLDPTLVHYTVGVLDDTDLPLSMEAIFLAADCLVVARSADPVYSHTDADRQAAALTARRGFRPTEIADPAREDDLDAVFAILRADLFA